MSNFAHLIRFYNFMYILLALCRGHPEEKLTCFLNIATWLEAHFPISMYFLKVINTFPQVSKTYINVLDYF